MPYLAFIFIFCVQTTFAHQWKKIDISDMNRQVIDGDTFKVDLNKDGTFSKRETVRLLYVDTPELSASHKGTNRQYGMLAKSFLEKALKKSQLKLSINPSNLYGSYNRILGILSFRNRLINLELIQKGHSYFDTRFQFPENYNIYAKAEKIAFEKKRGIWKSAKLRKSYLRRLFKERKTVMSSKNSIYHSKILDAKKITLSQFRKKFIRVRGLLLKQKSLSNGVELILLQHSSLPIQTVSFKPLPLWILFVKKNRKICIEGVVNSYKRNYQIEIYRFLQSC